MHWLFRELANKRNRKKIEKTIYKTFPSKFGNTIFTGSVFNNFFTYFSKACPFRQYRYITMHFAVHLYAFYHFPFVCFQTTIKIVQMNFGNLPRNCIKKL